MYKNDKKIAIALAEKVSKKGGTAYYVGGYVRDELMGVENKDIDIEVHGIETGELEEILDSIGTRIEIGKSFGIYNLKGCSVDVAMPRKEVKTGLRHRDFKVDVDPFIGTKKASERRDFTINAMMKNVLTGEIVDHYGGKEDLKNKIIRHVNSASFMEDPLRVLRGAQFAARFEFEIADETVKLCKTMDLTQLSRERIFEEMKKALIKAQKPSLFFKNLLKMNGLTFWFSEVSKLIGVKQNSKYHKEGDSYVHTMMVLDEAAKRRSVAEQPLWLMIAALCHDFGKITATEFFDGEYHAYNHETKGIKMTEEFLKRISSEKNMIKYVLNLSSLHMKPNQLAGCKASIKSTNKMFDATVSKVDLIHLAMADGLGKTPKSADDETENFLFERLSIYNEYMSRPFVEGKDLIEAGLSPSETFKEMLEFAHKLRLSGINKEDALKQTLSQYRKKH